MKRRWAVGVGVAIVSIVVIALAVIAVLSPDGLCAGVTDPSAGIGCQVAWSFGLVLAAIALVVGVGVALFAGSRLGGRWAVIPLLAWPALFVVIGLVMLGWALDPPQPPGATTTAPNIGMLIAAIAMLVLGVLPLAFARPIARTIQRPATP